MAENNKPTNKRKRMEVVPLAEALRRATVSDGRSRKQRALRERRKTEPYVAWAADTDKGERK